MRHVLLVLTALLSFTVHAGDGVCEMDLSGSKLLVGRPSDRLEAMAERLALAEFNRTVGENLGQAKDVETLISLRLSLGLMMYVVGIARPGSEPETYAVHASDRETQVTRLETNQPLTDDENTPERKIERVGLEAVSQKFPIGTAFPGTWVGKAPEVTHAEVAMLIPTGPDRGVVLIDVHGTRPKGPIVMHVVTEVRDEAIYTMSDLEFMKHEQNWGSSPDVTTPKTIETDGPRGITETRALLAVIEEIVKTEPEMRISATKVRSLNIAKTVFSVTVHVARGRLGDHEFHYNVIVGAEGTQVVSGAKEN